MCKHPANEFEHQKLEHVGNCETETIEFANVEIRAKEGVDLSS